MRAWLAGAAAWAAGHGAAGSAAFVLLYAGATACLLPASALTLAAGAVFGLAKGFVLCSIASTSGACLSFLLARRFLRGFAERLASGRPGFAAVRRAVADEGWRAVALCRLSPLLPFNVLNYAFGLTDLRFGEYALASWAGMLPGTFLYVYLGAAAGEAARGGSKTPAQWALLAAGLAATAVVVILIGRRARRLLAAR